MNEFHYTGAAQEIIFGRGALSHLGEAVEHFAWQRLLLCSGGSLRRNGTVATIESMLGERLVATYEDIQSHVPDFQVARAVVLARQHDIDAVIGLGGGSPIGLAKAVSFALEEGRDDRLPRAVPGGAQPFVPIIAIPTTYAGSEMTPVYGITRQEGDVARKVTVSDSRITPGLVIYDPLLTLDLPPEATASTGINALAHCIEALYSITHNPLSTSAAIGGISSIMDALPRCYRTGNDLVARSEMLVGAYLAGTALAHVSMALHHGLCHVLGGTASVPHGIANAIILPHAMRFNLATTAPQLALAAAAMGVTLSGRSAEAAVSEAIEKVSTLIGQMQLPQRLRDVGVREADLPRLAELAFQSHTVQNNPRPVTSAAQIEDLLRTAW
jgi:maleylacetate reductase